MEKTAIQWLIEQYKQDGHISIENASKAKEIEKKQILSAYDEGFTDYVCDVYQGEKYYQNTFGGSND